MKDFEFAAFALDLLAAHLEDWGPDKFCKAYVVGFLRETARLFEEDSYSTNREEAYRQQLRYCREHGFICLESYRRHARATAQRHFTGTKAAAQR